MRNTSEDIDIEIQQRDHKRKLLERLPDSKVTEEMNNLRLNKTSSKRKR